MVDSVTKIIKKIQKEKINSTLLQCIITLLLTKQWDVFATTTLEDWEQQG